MIKLPNQDTFSLLFNDALGGLTITCFFIGSSPLKSPNISWKMAGIKESKYIEEISVRYQLIDGGGIRMSGIDVHDMTKQVKKK